MAVRIKPPIALLREYLSHDPESRDAVWRPRRPEHFVAKADSPNARSACKRWNIRYAGKPAGSKSGHYTLIIMRPYQFYAHQAVWAMHTGEWPPEEIDHINRDPYDNRLSNLRLATRRQNKFNISRQKRRALPKGVKQVGQRYRARYCGGGREIALGSYATPEEAHAAYCEYVSKLHGEFFFSGED